MGFDRHLNKLKPPVELGVDDDFFDRLWLLLLLFAELLFPLVFSKVFNSFIMAMLTCEFCGVLGGEAMGVGGT